jgi:hypothetical protein
MTRKSKASNRKASIVKNNDINNDNNNNVLEDGLSVESEVNMILYGVPKPFASSELNNNHKELSPGSIYSYDMKSDNSDDVKISEDEKKRKAIGCGNGKGNDNFCDVETTSVNSVGNKNNLLNKIWNILDDLNDSDDSELSSSTLSSFSSSGSNLKDGNSTEL